MDGPIQEPIEGHFPVPHDLIGRLPHSEGFNLAFDDALAKLKSQKGDTWPDEPFRIKVEYAAEITVNPGSVGDYICIIG